MVAYQRGLAEVGDGVWAWLQPDGGWGWSNAGLVADAGESLLVDTLFDLRLTGEMLDAMRRAVPAAARIGTLVNTHANGDHCYGNQLVEGASIVASRRAAEEMSRVPPSNLAGLMEAAPGLGAAGEYLKRIFGPFDFSGIELTLPTEVFEGSLRLDVGGVAVELVELGPAHTAGDVVAVMPSRRVVFTGDLLFVGGHPIVWSGPVANWVAALDRILAMDVDTVVPGHGPVTGKRAVADLRAYFVELQEAVRPLWEEGLTPLDAARRLHLDRAAGWGEAERLVVNVAACFRDLAGPAAEGAGGGDALSRFADMAVLAGA
jgi:glyoxylase-like metal-dependent hydrolase (beta-lactamase superfamily II)